MLRWILFNGERRMVNVLIVTSAAIGGLWRSGFFELSVGFEALIRLKAVWMRCL